MVRHPEGLPQGRAKRQILAASSGWLGAMDTQGIGRCSLLLGAGRETKESSLDYGAGIRFAKTLGDSVKKGEVLATVYASTDSMAEEGDRKSVV